MDNHDEEMTLEQFQAFLQEKVDEFRQMWEEGMRTKAHYPSTMHRVDWLEQFDFWIEPEY